MGSNRNRRFAKRKRELEKKERADRKRAKKRSRSNDNGPGDMMAEPIPKATDEEIMAAVERAMNPGNKGAREQRGPSFGPRLFVGNLSSSANEQDLRTLFKEAGFEIADAVIPRDRTSGDPRGFAFVELSKASDAQRAIDAMDGASFHSRSLRVNAADRR